MWTAVAIRILIPIVMIWSFGSPKHEGLRPSHSRRSRVIVTDLLNEENGDSECDLANPLFTIIPCRFYEDMPHPLPPVEVNCTDMGFGGPNVARCTRFL